MSDEEKLYALMAIAEEQQAAAQRAIDGLVAEREKFSQQRAAVANLIRDLRETSERAAGAMETAAGAALQGAADESVTLVSHAVAEAFKRTLSPAMADLSEIVKRAANAEAQIRRTLAGFSWRSMLVISGAIFGILFAIWITAMISISWQRSQLDRLQVERATLDNDIRAMESQIQKLADRGGKVNLAVCGPQRRLCAQVDTRVRSPNDFIVLKGY